CGTWAGIRTISPAWTTVVSPSSKKNLRAPDMMRENCSLRWEWRGTMPPFAMKIRASVASSPLIIWREIWALSFSCSTFSNDVAAGMRHLSLGIARQGIVYRNGGIVNGRDCETQSSSREAVTFCFFAISHAENNELRYKTIAFWQFSHIL